MQQCTEGWHRTDEPDNSIGSSYLRRPKPTAGMNSPFTCAAAGINPPRSDVEGYSFDIEGFDI